MDICCRTVEMKAGDDHRPDDAVIVSADQFNAAGIAKDALKSTRYAKVMNACRNRNWSETTMPNAINTHSKYVVQVVVNCQTKRSKDRTVDELNNFVMSEKICHVCGKMRKRVWINENDIILVSVREFAKGKGDIIHKYTNDEARTLKKDNLIPNVELVNGKVEDNSAINFEYSNENDSGNQIQKQNRPYLDIEISEDEFEEDDIEEL